MKAPLERRLRRLAARTHKGFRASLRRAPLLVALTLLATVAGSVLIERMPRFFTMEETLDAHLPSVVASRRLETDFRAGVPLYVIFASRGQATLDAGELCVIARWLARGVYELGPTAPVLNVVSPFSLVKPQSGGGKVWFPKLLKPSCDHEDPPPAGAFAKSGVDVAAGLAGTPWAGLLAAPDGSDVLAEITLQGDMAPGHARFDAGTMAAADASLKRALAAVPDVSWRFFGPAAFRGYAKAATDADLLVNAAIPLVLLVLFRVLYGSWMGGLLAGIGIVVMRAILLGTMALAGFSADPLSGSLVLLVSLAAIEDFLFVSTHQLRTGAPWRVCYQRYLIPSFLTSLTTMLGFASLGLSPIKTVRSLGLWAAYGALVQWGVTYLLVPSLQSVWRRSQVWTRPERALAAPAVLQVANWRLPRPVGRLLLPLAAAAAFCIPHLTIEDSLGRFFPAAHPYSEAAAHLRQTRGWDGVMPVVVTTAAPSGTAATLAATLAQRPEVARVERGADLVGYLRQGLEPLTASMVERYASADDAYRSFFSAAHDERINVYLRDSAVGAARAVIGGVAAVCPPPACYAAGPLPIFVDFSEAVVRSLFESFASSLVVVGAFLVLYLRLKRQRPVWPVLVASFWGPVVMAGIMAALRIPVNFVSCFFAAVLVSLSGDNAIHYIYAAGRRPLAQGITARAHGSVEIAAAMIAITLLFLASAFAPPRTLGIVLSVGLVVNLVGDLFVLRLLTERGGGRPRAPARTSPGPARTPAPAPADRRS